MATKLNRRHLLAGAGLAVTAAAAGCGSRDKAAASPTPTGRNGASAATGGKLDENALRLKVASLLVVGFRGQTVHPADWIFHAIHDQRIGGVILFDTDQ